MSELKVGSKAPAFKTVDQHGKEVSLKDFAGKNVILYFYPKDDTPGCTKEACSFRDHFVEFKKRGAVVLGVSPDSAASHAEFIGKFSLPFTLLADEDHAIAEAYGVWGEKSMYGKTYMGILRTTFVIGLDGKISAVFPKVKPDEHALEVLEALGK